MLTSYKTSGAALLSVAALALLAVGGTAQAQSYRHIDYLALELERQAEDLHHEVHAHFRLTPQFEHLDHDVAELERLARHVHEVAHQRGSIAHLRHDLEQLDRLFHHIEELVAELAYTRGADRYAIYHLRSALRRMSWTLHHLRDDLRYLDGFDCPYNR